MSTQSQNVFLTDQSYEANDDPRLRKLVESANVFADIILQSRFSDGEKEIFARVIKQFNQLYWEFGIQTWMSTKWRGVPVLKPPTDLWIYQELIYTLRPDLIIECGSYEGGSALFLRDMMDLEGLNGVVWSVDIDHSKLNAKALARASNVDSGLIYTLGSSIDLAVFSFAEALVASSQKVMVILDSDHSYEQVSEELKLYAPLVSVGSVLIIEDTSNCPEALRAVQDYMFDHRHQFKADVMCEKLMLTFCREGFYERIDDRPAQKEVEETIDDALDIGEEI